MIKVNYIVTPSKIIKCNFGNIKKICLCGSIRFRETILKVMKAGEKKGIEFLFPNIEREDSYPKNGSEPILTSEEIEKLEQEHIKAINSVYTIYVINPGGLYWRTCKIRNKIRQRKT